MRECKNQALVGEVCSDFPLHGTPVEQDEISIRYALILGFGVVFFGERPVQVVEDLP